MITSPQKYDFDKDDVRRARYMELKEREAIALRKVIKELTDIKQKIIFQLRLADVEKELDKDNAFDLIENRIDWCEDFISLKQKLYDYNCKLIKSGSISELEEVEKLLENMEIEADIEAKMSWVAKYREHLKRNNKT